MSSTSEVLEACLAPFLSWQGLFKICGDGSSDVLGEDRIRLDDVFFTASDVEKVSISPVKGYVIPPQDFSLVFEPTEDGLRARASGYNGTAGNGHISLFFGATQDVEEQIAFDRLRSLHWWGDGATISISPLASVSHDEARNYLDAKKVTARVAGSFEELLSQHRPDSHWNRQFLHLPVELFFNHGATADSDDGAFLFELSLEDPSGSWTDGDISWDRCAEILNRKLEHRVCVFSARVFQDVAGIAAGNALPDSQRFHRPERIDVLAVSADKDGERFQLSNSLSGLTPPVKQYTVSRSDDGVEVRLHDPEARLGTIHVAYTGRGDFEQVFEGSGPLECDSESSLIVDYVGQPVAARTVSEFYLGQVLGDGCLTESDIADVVVQSHYFGIGSREVPVEDIVVSRGFGSGRDGLEPRTFVEVTIASSAQLTLSSADARIAGRNIEAALNRRAFSDEYIVQVVRP